MKLKKINLLNISNIDSGYLLMMNIDVEKLLLAGIVELNLSKNYGKQLRYEVFESYDVDEFMPSDKSIKKFVKRKYKDNKENSILKIAKDLSKGYK